MNDLRPTHTTLCLDIPLPSCPILLPLWLFYPQRCRRGRPPLYHLPIQHRSASHLWSPTGRYNASNPSGIRTFVRTFCTNTYICTTFPYCGIVIPDCSCCKMFCCNYLQFQLCIIYVMLTVFHNRFFILFLLRHPREGWFWWLRGRGSPRQAGG